MAKNTAPNKRLAIKWVRDRAKAAYDKKSECFICGTSQDLELHHVNGLTNLFELWAKKQGISIDTDEAVLEVRDRFIEEHYTEIYVEVFTLCEKHHQALHRIYGKSPALSTTKKQISWIEKQKAKLNGTYVEETPKKSTFGKFLVKEAK